MRALAAVAVTVALAHPVAARRPEPDAAGPLAVGTRTLALTDRARARTLVTEVWYPARRAGADTPAIRRRFPLVLAAHGHCGSRTNYTYLTAHLAGWGFVVAAPDFPGVTRADCDRGVPLGDVFNDSPRDLAAVAAALRAGRDGGEALRGAVRRSARATALVGHSLGGLVVMRAAVGAPRTRAVVLLAAAPTPTEAGALAARRRRPAMLSLGGTADATIPIEGVASMFALLPTPAWLVRITGGTHSGFADVDARLPPDALARQQALVRRYVSAFLRRTLGRDRRSARVLTAADAAARGDGLVELVVRRR
jgi:predicted dienelactone hydrolase